MMIATTYLAVSPTTVSEPELADVAGGLRFESTTLGDAHASSAMRSFRRVHPSLKRISAWISAVGAGVALADLDGNGFPNDACHVDPRTDSVVIQPLPGTVQAYAPIRLEPPPSPHATAPMGCLAGDMDEDGRLDLVVYFWGRTPVGFLQRGPMEHPSFTAFEIVPGRERWYTNAGLFSDLDGDAHADLVFGNYFPDGARILDVQGDGVEWMQRSMSRARNGGSKQLWRWRRVADGIPAFEGVKDAIDPDLIHGWSLAIGAADLDGDARPELMFANDFGPDHLMHNRSSDERVSFALLRGERDFLTPASKVLGRDSFKGMGVDFGDVNGDGWLDFYVSNIAAEFSLEESHQLFVSTGRADRMGEGMAPFVDQSEPLRVSRSGWAWDARLADFDNDGTLEIVQATGFLHGTVNRWPELHELAMGNDALLSDPRHWPKFEPGADLSGRSPNPFFKRRDEGAFHDVASLIGTDQAQVTRALAIADVDRDGLVDYAAANQWEPSRFYRNVSRIRDAFVGLDVIYAVDRAQRDVRVESGRVRVPRGSPAFGASVEVRLPGGRRWVAQVDGGSGHSGKRAPEVHVGLGSVAADTPVTIAISWRTADGLQHASAVVRPGWHAVWLPARDVRSAVPGGGNDDGGI
jgi:hypothetical protein